MSIKKYQNIDIIRSRKYLQGRSTSKEDLKTLAYQKKGFSLEAFLGSLYIIIRENFKEPTEKDYTLKHIEVSELKGTKKRNCHNNRGIKVIPLSLNDHF